jgi:hypothetical protein
MHLMWYAVGEAHMMSTYLTLKHSVWDLWLCSGGEAERPGSAPGVPARACTQGTGLSMTTAATAAYSGHY